MVKHVKTCTKCKKTKNINKFSTDNNIKENEHK